MAINLERLPNEILVAILVHVPLNDLYSNVSLVSSRFYDLHLIALEQRDQLLLLFCTKQQLITTLARSQLAFAQHDAIPLFTRELQQNRLANLHSLYFPSAMNLTIKLHKLTTLHIAILCEPHVNTLQHIITLLTSAWGRQLETFKLSFLYPTQSKRCLAMLKQQDYVQFWRAINSLTSLTHLSIEDCNDYLQLSNLPRFQLATLRKLREFNLYAPNAKADSLLFDSLTHFGTLSPKTQVRMDMIVSSIKDLPNIYQNINKQFTTDRIKHFSIGFFSIAQSYETQLRQFTNHFASLTSLTVHYNSLEVRCTLTELASYLSSLHHLAHLELRCYSAKGPFYLPRDWTATNVESLTSLPGVKSLKLDGYFPDHHLTGSSTYFAKIFPELELLIVANRSSSCVTCGYECLNHKFDWYMSRSKCVAKLVTELFRVCSPTVQRVAMVLPHSDVHLGKNYHGVEREWTRESCAALQIELKNRSMKRVKQFLCNMVRLGSSTK